MAIRFKCPHCQKPLTVKDEMAGKRAVCPACKKPIVVPAPVAAPADLEAFAAAALSEQPAQAAVDENANKTVDFDCPFCAESVKVPFELAGKQTPCPECRHIVKVPMPKIEKRKDWRDLLNKGPAGAIVNQPEQLDGAWGTEVKARVGRDALEQGGAIPEAPAEPVGVGGWIKRGLIGTTALGIIVLFTFAVMRNRAKRGETDAIANAYELKERLAADPKQKLHPVLAAEIERADGILRLRRDLRDTASDSFKKARGLCLEAGKDSPLDHDLCLIHIALSQFELGGTEDQIKAKARFDWDKEVISEVIQTLRNLKSPEARVIAVRDLGSVLIARKQVPLAIALATTLGGQAQAEKGQSAPGLAQLSALLLAHGNDKKIDNPVKPPDPSKPLEQTTRLAYAEGYARNGELDKARELVKAKGLPHQRLEAAIGVASVLIADKSDSGSATKAGSFIADSLEIVEKELKSVAVWQTFQLCRVAFRTEHAGRAQEFATRQKLPGNFKRRLQLEWIEAQLEKGRASADLVKELPDKDAPPARTLAWVRLAGQLGDAVSVPDEEGDEAQISRAFADIGRKLGQHETTSK